MNNFLKKNYLLIIIFILAIFFRFFNLGTQVLHTDEAEVYLASQNILSSGVPKGFFRVPFYENAYLYESNSSMYKFESTNYYKTNLVLRKGWLPYYITAFFSLFGKSEFLLRFPFALLSVISLFFFFKLTKLLFNKRTALIASFFYAVSPSLLFYERMIRYYSPMLLFIILSVYFYMKTFKDDHKKYYFLGSISLVSLFYTNILIFAILCLTLLVFFLYNRIKISKNLIHSDILILILIIPWIIFTGFIFNIEKESGEISAPIFQSITAGINNQGTLYIPIYLSIILLLANIFFRKQLFKTIFYWKKKTSNNFIFIYLSLFIILPFLLSPPSSFEEKLFLSLIPFSLIIIAKLFDSLIKLSDKKIFKYIIIISIILFSSVHIDFAFGQKGHNLITPKEIINLERNVLFEELENLIKDQTTKNPLILTTFEHFPLMFYTNYSAQIIWPVRKSFIDNYDDELVIIETSTETGVSVEGVCNFFHQYFNPVFWCENKKNYLDRIKDCKGFAVDESTNLYFCKARNKFIGGSQGLFFGDFPEAQPPDFIWDLDSFPVAINVENLGEVNVDKLKVVFTDDFGGEEFDSEEEFLFQRNINASKKVSSEIISSSEYFNLGNVTFNHKLLNKLMYVNASVLLCYPYTTFVRVDLCEDSLSICGFDVSGAPVQIGNINFEDLSFNFSIFNSAEGFIGDFEGCGLKNASKILRTSSDSFKCTPFKGFFSCEGVSSRLKSDNSYFINIDYDYQQEFKKALLLRSKEKNRYDYENFYKD